jgi:hypothetical protein
MKNIPSGFVKLDSLSIKEYREFISLKKEKNIAPLQLE